MYKLQLRNREGQSVTRHKNIDAVDYVRDGGWIAFKDKDENVFFEIQEFDVVSIELIEGEE